MQLKVADYILINQRLFKLIAVYLNSNIKILVQTLKRICALYLIKTVLPVCADSLAASNIFTTITLFSGE